MQVLKHRLGGRAPEVPTGPTLEDALPLEANFKTVAHEAKVIRNAALQAYSPGTARPYVLNHRLGNARQFFRERKQSFLTWMKSSVGSKQNVEVARKPRCHSVVKTH